MTDISFVTDMVRYIEKRYLKRRYDTMPIYRDSVGLVVYCSGEGVGLVINRLRVRLPVMRYRVSTWMGDRLLAGKSSRYVAMQSSRSTQPSIPPG